MDGRKPCKMTTLYQAFLITIIVPSLMGLPTSSNIYNISITTECPLNTTSHKDAKLRKNCSGNTRYMCAPYKDLSYLLEYCTSTSRSLFIEGNCLTLQGSGFLDTFNCKKKFVNGCPNTSFHDENLYKFPACNLINTDQKCFLAEKNCLTAKRKETSTVPIPRTMKTTESDESFILPTVLAVCSILLVSACITSFVIWKLRRATRSISEDEVPSLEGNLDTMKEIYERTRETMVPIYCVKGYVVGYSGLKDDLLKCLQHVKHITFDTDDLKPIFTYPNRGSSLKTTGAKLSKRIDTHAKNQDSCQDSETFATLPMLNDDDVEDGNEQTQLQLNEPSHFNKVLNLRDFSGKSDSFCLQQTSLCKDVFYIFAIDMAQKLDEPSQNAIEGRKWRKLRDYYAQWMDIILTYREELEQDCLFIFVATNADNLSDKAQHEYFAELWEMYEQKSGKRIDENVRHKRECVFKKSHPKVLPLKAKNRVCHCIENSLEKNPKWGIMHPLFWRVIQKFILEKRKTYPLMRRDDLFTYCAFMEESEFIEMLVYFNYIGLVVFIDREPFRNNVILDVGWFWNAVEKMTNTHYFQRKHSCDARHFLETGLLTLREFNEIWKEKENKSTECGSFLQSLEMVANFTETSETDEAIYVPCMNKKPVDDMSIRFRQSSILCFRFQVLPACLFHRIVVHCIEKMDWEVRTDKCGKNLFDSAAIFKFQNHNILIGCNGNLVEARIFTIDTMFIDTKLSLDVRRILEDFLRNITIDIYPTALFQVGYRCKVLAKFCDSSDSCFLTEEQLCESNHQECPQCSKMNPHSIQADRILEYWTEVSDRAQLKENLEEDDEREQMDEDNKVASPIWKACNEGNVTQFKYEYGRKQAKKQLNRGFLNKHDKDGKTILHIAAKGGSCEIFAALVEIDKNSVLERTEIGQTVLHIACKNAKLKMCIHLLSNYPNLLRMETNRGWSASHFAAWGGDDEIMQYLEEKGLDLTLNTSEGYSILHIAAKYNRYNMCVYILKNHSELLVRKTEDGLNVAHYAAKRCNLKLLQLLEEDMNILEQTESGKTILHIACETGDTTFFNQIVGMCTQILQDVDKEGWNALHFAAKSGNVEIAKKLIKRGIQSVKALDGKTILHIACTYKHFEMCRHIINNFPDLINKCNFRGWNAAHYVVVDPPQNDSIKILDLLLQFHINLEKVTDSGNTVLTMACCYKNTKIIKHLVHEYPNLLHISSRKSLSDAVNDSNDVEIRTLIDEAVKRSSVS
ncbi:uncharacterized protein LOC125654360 isoform X2 [Ostrea edulis]|nr:uncharacterized protein LOC125654360 isoform X2 [Ostrea edulis]XP_048740262.1 uncharacterized protein LOC125654360 isoform X2 [Ostrea edulis]